MKPSFKDVKVTHFINNMIGENREEVIQANRCVKPPFGCGQPIGAFRDALSEKEYTISGLCQECQDKVFGK